VTSKHFDSQLSFIGRKTQDVVSEMKEKMQRLILPRGYSAWPVLIHVNGVHESVEQSRYFSHIVSMADFFNTSTTSSGCLSATPVAYTITSAGQATAVTMYAQCYTTITSGFTGDPGLILIGSKGGKTYVYDVNGAAWTAAIATPDGSSYDIHAWYSAGIGNGASGTGGGQCGSAWDKCSYGVAEVYTNAAAGTFEMVNGTSTDSVHFGPTTVPGGVTKF